MKRIVFLLPVLAFLGLAACDYPTGGPAADPSVGTVRTSPTS